MSNEATNRLIDALMPLLLAIGISMEADKFLGGLALAVFAALTVRYFLPERDRREIVLTLAAAVLLAIAAASAGALWLPDVAVQIKMMVAGAGGRFVVKAFAGAGLKVEKSGPRAVDLVTHRVLPVPEKDKEPPE